MANLNFLARERPSWVRQQTCSPSPHKLTAPIGITEAFKADSFKEKINLGK